MTTPAAKEETLERVAKRLPKDLYNIVCFACSEAFCKHWQEEASDLILSALRNEREACAKVADDKAAYHVKRHSEFLVKHANVAAGHSGSKAEACSEVAAAIRERTE